MVKHRALLLLLLLALGCRGASPVATPSTPPDPLPAMLDKAAAAQARGDREGEALQLRQAVEMLGARRPEPSNLAEVRRLCTLAMVEAGGNADSFRLWSDLASKDPKDGKRMRERARKLMLQQAGELVAQVDLDLQERHPEDAVCTARAALELLRLAKAGPQQVAPARAAEAKALHQRDSLHR
jgi:hypothetical protein